MRKSTERLTLAFLVSFCVCWLLDPAQPLAQQPDWSPREVIVSWRADTHAGAREVSSLSAGGRLVHDFRIVDGSLVWLPDSAAEEQLRRNPLVASVIPNRQLFPAACNPGYLASDGPYCEDCGGGGDPPPDPSPQRVPHGVSRIGASPGNLAFTGSGVGVAVMDSGINGLHRDFIRANGTRVVSLNCRKDDSVPSCDSDVAPGTTGGHGTKVAGVIAAVNNNVDLVGVAPDSTVYNVNVYKLNAGGFCPGSYCTTDADLILGLSWIQDNHNLVSPPIQVINVSLARRGDRFDNDALRMAFQAVAGLGIVTVVAAGNWPSICGIPEGPVLEVKDVVPAAYRTVMAIASTTAIPGSVSSPCGFPGVPADTASWWTVDGPFDSQMRLGVTVSAPGEDKEDLDGGCGHQLVGLEVLTREGSVDRDVGTSFSSPHVAGVVALMKQQTPTYIQIVAQDHIRASADRRGVAPLDSTHTLWTFDGEREGVVWAPGALQP